MTTDSMQDVSSVLLKFLNTPKKRYTIDEYMDPLRELGFDDETLYATVRQLSRDGLVEETGENGYYLELTSAGVKIAQADLRGPLPKAGIAASVDSSVTMRLTVPFFEFRDGVLAFRSTLESLKGGKIESDDDLAQTTQRFEETRNECSGYIRNHASPDIGTSLSNAVRYEDRYREQGIHPFHQRKKAIQDRITGVIRSIDYVLGVVQLSDPLMQARSFVEERSGMSVKAKSDFLLNKLYDLRKSPGYWDTNMIFEVNQVEVDDYDEPREITMGLYNRGLVEKMGYQRSLGAKITTEGKDHVELYRAAANAPATEVIPEPTRHPPFVHPDRIQDLEQLQHPDFDLSKLIQLCHEVNDNYERGNYLSVAMLGRSILDHVPPLFGHQTFDQVVGGHGGRSFKSVMTGLNTTMRSIADSYLHLPIRKRETLPTATQVNFSQAMDVLLQEVVRISK